MHKIFYILLILLFACESPFDVPAREGEKKVIKDPYLNNPVLKIIPDSLDFGYVLPSEKNLMNFRVINISGENYLIKLCKFYNELFICKNEELTLAPHKTSQDTATFTVVFMQNESGLYIDSMIIDNMYRPVLYASAKVPFVYAEDMDFGKVSVNEISGKIIKIRNNSTDSVTLTSIYLENNQLFRFSQKPELPLKIAPKSSSDILLRFSSDKKGEFSDKLIFEIEENLLIKNNANLEAAVN